MGKKSNFKRFSQQVLNCMGVRPSPQNVFAKLIQSETYLGAQ